MRSIPLNYCIFIVLVLSIFTPILVAAEIVFPLTYEFSGAVAPSGQAPWLVVSLTDKPGYVELTLDATGLVGSEFVFGAYLNMDTNLNPNDLSIDLISKVGSFDEPAYSYGVNAFKADGDGLYDILLSFARGGGANKRFGAGEVAVFSITSIVGLSAVDFDVDSQPAGGHGPFRTAAHVGGIGLTGDDSGWITTPEPATMSLLALGAVALLRKRK